jgi:hypothetical protein
MIENNKQPPKQNNANTQAKQSFKTDGFQFDIGELIEGFIRGRETFTDKDFKDQMSSSGLNFVSESILISLLEKQVIEGNCDFTEEKEITVELFEGMKEQQKLKFYKSKISF